ncbi:MAG: DEAD/DEAH box helicase family protein [Spirochaetes bacterium]|jgi:hypothetical protein|nr:DEAD/DEAH box helicase family protein [Spirochaetota bacterium]
MATAIKVKGAQTSQQRSYFADRLVLAEWFINLFGATDFNDLTKELKDHRYEGYDDDFVAKYVPLLASKLPVSGPITRDMLVQYDTNIYQYTVAISKKRENPVQWKYFQYLSLLFTEIYLERYFTDQEKLLQDLNAFLDEFNTEIPEKERIKPYEPSDLNKLSFWNATGSGKTLIMHLNIMQYLYYFRKHSRDKLARIILLTPNAGLSEQHRKEFALSSIHAEFFDKNTSRTISAGDSVEILDIFKLEEETGKTTIAVESLEGNNLVLVDEGHRGASGDKWLDMRNRLCETGFSFEYSATFGQAIESASSKNKADLYQLYAKCIIFDYSYRFFYKDGYGKDYQVLNLPDDDPDKKKYYLTAALLAFYQQKRFYLDSEDTLSPFLIENPLMVFVGSSVIGRKSEGSLTGAEKTTISDVGEVIAFLSDFVKDKAQSVKRIKLLLSGKTGLLDNHNNDIFASGFRYLKTIDLEEDKIYQGMLQTIFGCSASGAILHVENLKGIPGEVGIRVGDNDYFGVINIGEDTSFIKICEQYGVATGERDFAESLFHSINSLNSKINILIGSKKFSEGWNSWRVSTMGLINIGTKEGTQIIQLFGRGVRLKGFKMSLKRSNEVHPSLLEDINPPIHIDVMETLHIFGVRANYIQKFKEYLEEEGVPDRSKTITIELPVIRDIDTKKLKIMQLRRDANFKEKAPFAILDIPPEAIKNRNIVLNWYPKIQSVQSEIIFSTSQEAILSIGKFSEAHVAFMNFEEIFFELNKFKSERRWYNLVIDKSILRNLILDDSWYTLYIPAPEMVFDDFKKVKKWQEIATLLLKKYCERYYSFKRGDYEKDKRKYVSLYEYEEELHKTIGRFKEKDSNYNSGNIINHYDVEVKESETELIKYIKDLGSVIEKGKLDDIKNFSNLEPLVFSQHLYKPLIYLKDKSITVAPVALQDSEANFVKDLKTYYTNNKEFFKKSELFLLRNLSRGRGFGFFEAENFYPDFILWLLIEKKQYITFIEPHGLAHSTANDKKVHFYKTIKEIEKEIGDTDVILNSFILSATEYKDVNNIWHLEKEAIEKMNVLFMRDDNANQEYLKKLFYGILGKKIEQKEKQLSIPDSRKIVYLDDYRGHEYIDALPVYSLEAACGKFGDGRLVEPEGWVAVHPRKGMGEGWFVIKAIGSSMEPKIPHGDLCVFKPVSAGSKQGKIYLFQLVRHTDPENGAAYTIKQYLREGDRNIDGMVEKITLKSINHDCKDLIYEKGDEDFEERIKIIGEFIITL